MTSRHLQHGRITSWGHWDSYLPAGSDQILLEKVCVVRFGHRDARMAEDLRQLVDVAARLEPAGAKRVTQRVRCDACDLRSLRALGENLA